MLKQLAFLIFFHLSTVISDNFLFSRRFLAISNPQLIMINDQLRSLDYEELLSRFDWKGLLFQVARELENRSTEIFLFYIFKTMPKEQRSQFYNEPTFEQLEKLAKYVEEFYSKGTIDKSYITNQDGCEQFIIFGKSYVNKHIDKLKEKKIKGFDEMITEDEFNTYIEDAIKDKEGNVIAERVVTEGEHLKNLLARVKEDEMIIKAMLELQSDKPLRLKEIKLNNGDHHVHGGGVSILSFYKDDGDADVKLVYKTGPVRPDYITVGSTVFYNNLRDKLPGTTKNKLVDYELTQSFYEILDSSQKDEKYPVSFVKPYKVVPVEADENGRPLSIKDSYGYIEFIEGDLFRYTDVKELITNAESSEYIENSPFYQLGFLHGSMLFLGAIDLHDENLVVSKISEEKALRLKMTPIDMEVMFSPPLGPELKDIVKYLTDNLFLNPMAQYLKNRDQAFSQYDDGKQAFNKLIHENVESLAKWINSEAVRTTPIRFLPTNTSALINELWCIPFVIPPYSKNQLFVMNKNFLDKLGKWEIPAFYAYANDDKLYDADGQLVLFDSKELLEALSPSNRSEFQNSLEMLEIEEDIKRGSQFFDLTPRDNTFINIKNYFDVDFKKMDSKKKLLI